MKLDPRSSQAQFSVAYDGGALRDGSMDVKDLAPALLALGALCEEASKTLNGTHADVSIKVTAVERGSFLVALDVLQELTSLFTNTDSADARSILTYLGVGFTAGAGVTVGLLKLRRLLKGRPVKGVTLDNGSTQINIKGNKNVVVLPEVKSLYDSVTVNRQLAKTIAPLHSPGITTMRFMQGEEIVETIHESELGDFRGSVSVEFEDEVLEYEGIYRIDRVSFADNLTWTLSNRDHSFTAHIADGNFQNRVNNRTSAFLKGDQLHVRIQQRIRKSTGRSSFTVLEVIKHHQAAQQEIFDLNDDG